MDVIRVWERRYGVVTPERDEAGRRLYSDGDVSLLALLAEATSAGRSIGQLSGLDRSDLEALVREDRVALRSRIGEVGPGPAPDQWVERALELTRALDGPGLEVDLRRAATLLGLAEFLEGVVAPLFRRIGEEWHAGRLSVAQEHLASVVAGSLVARLAGSLAVGTADRVVVVAAPSGEHHEIGALLVSAAASGAGWRVVYLGPNVPAADIAGAARQAGARCVAMSVGYGNGRVARAEVAAVRDALPSAVDVVIGGARSHELEAVTGVDRLEDLESFVAYLDAL